MADAVVSVGLDPHGREEFPGGRPRSSARRAPSPARRPARTRPRRPGARRGEGNPRRTGPRASTRSRLVPAITQTPTSVGLSKTAGRSPVFLAALAARNASAPGATGAGSTTTVMPSASTRRRRRLHQSRRRRASMPSRRADPRRIALIVADGLRAPSTTRVTCLLEREVATPATSTTPTTTDGGHRRSTACDPQTGGPVSGVPPTFLPD